MSCWRLTPPADLDSANRQHDELGALAVIAVVTAGVAAGLVIAVAGVIWAGAELAERLIHR